MTELWRIRRDTPAPASTVLAEAAGVLGDDAVGWLACPLRLRPVRCAGGIVSAADGPADLGGVFSLRVFGPDVELRWGQSDGGRGAAVLITESPVTLPGWTATAVDVVTTLDGGYALWGTRFTPTVTGWCRAAERRTGPIDVPVHGPLPTGDGEHLSLGMREYVAADEHGNARVVEERLLDIRTTTATTGATR